MTDPRRAGRIIGALLLLQMFGSALVNFGLERPLFEPPGFLVDATLHASQIGLAALVGLVIETLWIGVAVTLFPFAFARARPLTLWLVALAGVCVAVAVVENGSVMSMLSLSNAYAAANGAERQYLESARVAVAAARNWTHFLARMLDGCTTFVLMAVFYRCALIPRALAACALAATVLQVVGVGMPLFGRPVNFLLLAPTGLTLLLVAAVLLVTGLHERVRSGYPADASISMSAEAKMR
jgi:hypothetical protein